MRQPVTRRDRRPLWRRHAGQVCLLGLTLLLAGCRGCPSKRPPIHLNPNMDNQPKLLPQAASEFFADGAAMRRPVEGTVAQGELRERADWWEGKDAAGGFVTALPMAVDDRVLRRGEERYGVFCGPCHGPQGDGKGMLFQRSQVLSADLLAPRLRTLPAGQLYDVITHGMGLMPPYGAQIPVEDRWAIVAFMRELQAANPASEADAPAEGAGADAAPSGEPAVAAPAAAAPPAPAGDATDAATPPAAAGAEGRR